jgi:subtilisin family serine protease/subtilisin-like proprotein convertase family protein
MSIAQDTNTISFRFLEPQARAYQFAVPAAGAARTAGAMEWITGVRSGETNEFHFGRRIVLELEEAANLESLLPGRPLDVTREVVPRVWLLEAPDAWTAVQQADALGQLPGVRTCHPVVRRPAALRGIYARRPNDRYYSEQWYLEHRDTNGALAGADLNVRAAWPSTRGEGVVVAVADTGVELTHPELAARATGMPHWNFNNQTSDATPLGSAGETAAHGTGVAGLILAEADNGIGMAGVAPEAKLAAWNIFDTQGMPVSDDQLMDMYQLQPGIVGVQNHSWGKGETTLAGPTLLEQIGISNAVTHGRGGKGVIMLRAAGNLRAFAGNANEDGYVSDPRVIAVAAVRSDGRATRFSEPGACVLVAAPAEDLAGNGLFSTDLLGTRGVNFFTFNPPDESLWDYRYRGLGFTGTSASAPLVSGIVALALSVNPGLTVRDVQHILALGSRHFDLTDPDLRRNGAGHLVSHNVGYGIPDAAHVVSLARHWSNRPPAITIRHTNTIQALIRDAGALLVVRADGVADRTVVAAPGNGPQPPTPMPELPLVDLGNAEAPIAQDLTGKAALIRRSSTTFASKVDFAAEAGAAFAIIYNNATGTAGCPGGDTLCPMAGLEFTTIPAAFIGQTDGESLAAQIDTNATTRATMGVLRSVIFLDIPNPLLLEHVGLRVVTDHPRRGDLRITLTSPMGTRSVLQHYNADVNPGPTGWTYYSVQHFGESSAGTWTVSFSDAFPDNEGRVHELVLELTGIPITDIDRDGLDDGWEQLHFGSLLQGPQADPDGDGQSNAREQILGTSPVTAPETFVADLSILQTDKVRLSWPAVTNRLYEVLSVSDVGGAFSLITNVAGRFPERELILSSTNLPQGFFRVRTVEP